MIGSQANTGRCLTKFIGQARSLELELLLLPLLLSLMLHGMSVVRYTRWPVAHAQKCPLATWCVLPDEANVPSHLDHVRTVPRVLMLAVTAEGCSLPSGQVGWPCLCNAMLMLPVPCW